jgi:glycerol-3-phosphate dehydrogenase
MKFTGITEADVVGTWAGLRPLVKSGATGKTADLSRRHKVTPSESGVVTITGGKLTTYREMAADSVDAVVAFLGRADGIARRSRTKNLRLRGAEGYEALAADADPLVAHLADRYGGEAATVLALIDTDRSLAEPLVAGLPYVRAEAVYAARYEMARSVDDVLTRRTRARLLARDASAAAANDVAQLLAPVLGWSDAEAEESAEAYRDLPETALQGLVQT